MAKLTGQTDQEVEFRLPSAIISATWVESSGYVNGKVTAELRTLNVGDGAPVQIVLKNRKGEALQTYSGVMVQGLHRRLIPLGADAAEGVFFEAKWPDHSLSCLGPALPVGPAIALGKPAWEDSESGDAVTTLRRGMSLALTCPQQNIPAGQTGHFVVYCKLGERPAALLARIMAKIEGDSLKAQWIFDYRDATLGLGADADWRRTGESYNVPKIQLGAECLGIIAEGPEAPFRDVQRIAVVDAFGAPAPEQKVKLHLPDGSTREAKADAEGMVVLEDVPPGKVHVEWVIEET